MCGPPMYLSSISEAEPNKEGPAQDKFSRLQRTLGGAFNGIWPAWVRKSVSNQGGPWVSVKSDPKKNSVQLCEDFLQAWGKRASTPTGWTTNTSSA
eukprot:1371600-Pyramimonas_sp.AAC.1